MIEKSLRLFIVGYGSWVDDNIWDIQPMIFIAILN